MKPKIISHGALLVTFLLMGIQISAVSPTPTVNLTTGTVTATPTVSEKSKQIEDLKERLATKVAELRQAQRMAVYGTVKSVSISQFYVETKTKDLKIELTDDIKIYQTIKESRTELTSDKLAKDDIVTVFGDYDATLDLLKAKIVFIQSTDPIRISGTIKEINKTDYAITIESAEKITYIVDFEKTTKMSVWNGKEIEKAGFSKLAVGNIIHVAGSPVPKQDKRISAQRIVNLGSDTKGFTPPATPTPTEKPATPSATPKS